MSKKTAVYLPDELHARLHALAKRTDRTVSDCIREAVEEQLGELEDMHLGEQAAERARRGDEDVLSAEAFWRGLGD